MNTPQRLDMIRKLHNLIHLNFPPRDPEADMRQTAEKISWALKFFPRQENLNQIIQQFEKVPEMLILVYLELRKSDLISCVQVNSLPVVQFSRVLTITNRECPYCKQVFCPDEILFKLTCNHHVHKRCYEPLPRSNCLVCQKAIDWQCSPKYMYREEIINELLQVLRQKHTMWWNAYGELMSYNYNQLCGLRSEPVISELPILKFEGRSECYICFEKFKMEENVLVLTCKHYFHRNCIIQWLRHQLTCPVCRAEVKLTRQSV